MENALFKMNRDTSNWTAFYREQNVDINVSSSGDVCGAFTETIVSVTSMLQSGCNLELELPVTAFHIVGLGLLLVNNI